MGIVLRLARHGCTNRPFFHLVAIERKRARNSGAYLEQLGTYDPMPNDHNEKLVSLNLEGIRAWLAKGAELSKPVAMLLGQAGLLPIHPTNYIHARRAKLKKATIERMAEEAAKQAEAAKEDEG